MNLYLKEMQVNAGIINEEPFFEEELLSEEVLSEGIRFAKNSKKLKKLSKKIEKKLSKVKREKKKKKVQEFVDEINKAVKEFESLEKSFKQSKKRKTKKELKTKYKDMTESYKKMIKKSEGIWGTLKKLGVATAAGGALYYLGVNYFGLDPKVFKNFFDKVYDKAEITGKKFVGGIDKQLEAQGLDVFKNSTSDRAEAASLAKSRALNAQGETAMQQATGAEARGKIENKLSQQAQEKSNRDATQRAIQKATSGPGAQLEKGGGSQVGAAKGELTQRELTNLERAENMARVNQDVVGDSEYRASQEELEKLFNASAGAAAADVAEIEELTRRSDLRRAVSRAERQTARQTRQAARRAAWGGE